MERLQAQSDFDASRRHAFWNELLAVLTGRSRTLLSFNEVMHVAKLEGQIDRGVHDIPVSQIRGSEGRARDFDATFLPLNPRLRERWSHVEALMLRGVELPPIEVYKVADLYFVRDGHHRVSVARRLGQESILANVIEVRTRVPLGPDVDAHELLCSAEYASFLEVTQLDRLCPEARMECKHLGHYDVIYEHILGHRYLLSQDRGYELPLSEAVVSWYTSVYRPVMEVVRKHRIAEHFPDWTEGDLYLAVTRRWLELSHEDGSAGPEGAGAALLQEAEEREHSAARLSMLRRWLRQRIRRTLVLGTVLTPLRRRRSS
jgi:uncharacterized ParB-like nuclease family protein